MFTEYDINFINKIEYKYSANSFDGTPGDPIRYLKGSNDILVSAPHAVNQLRGDKIKMGERYTGAMAEILHQITGCHMISKLHNNHIDDNFVLHTEYKDMMGEIIDKNDIFFVLDLHGMLSSLDTGFRGYHIEIGTNDGKNLLDKTYLKKYAVDSLNQYGITEIRCDHIFKASKPYTISNYVANNFNTPSMQMEVSSDYRNPNFSIANFNKIIKSIVKLISIVNSNR